MELLSRGAQHRFTDLNKLRIPIRLGDHTGEFLYWGYFPAEYWRNYLHVHSFFEVCYAYQGDGIFRINDREIQIGAGQLFIAKPNEPHEIISSLDNPLGIYFWSYTLLPTGGTPPAQHRPTPEGDNQRDLTHLLRALNESSRSVSGDAGAIWAVLGLLTEEITTRRPGFRQKIYSLATTLLIDTARAISAGDVESTPLIESGAEPVAKIVRYLNDNYDRPIQIRDVAAQLHMSERHTSRIFQQATGISIQKYLVQLRVSIAQQRLLDHNLSISEIAHSLGYSDARHFSTLFRKHTGRTPTAFRNENGTQFLA